MKIEMNVTVPWHVVRESILQEMVEQFPNLKPCDVVPVIGRSFDSYIVKHFKIEFDSDEQAIEVEENK